MFKLLLGALLFASVPQMSFADDVDDQLAKHEDSLSKDAKHADYIDSLKSKYSLTDEQVKAMQDQGMNAQQMTMAAQLSKSSEKPLEDVLKMRNEDKMGWGKIAKELGVHPSELGKGVSSMRHERNKERRVARSEKRGQRKERRESRRDARKTKKNQ